MREVCTFASYFVICSGESDRQLKAIGEEIEHNLKKSNERVLHQEGTADSGWMIYDYGDVVIHIFAPAERDFYQLDELWHQGKTIVRIQ